jgi:hypothetical protein
MNNDEQWDNENNEPELPSADLNLFSQRNGYGASGSMDTYSIRMDNDINYSFTTPNVGLNSSLYISNSETYHCPVHGPVTSWVRFEIAEDEAEVYCLRCWRDFIRQHLPQSILFSRSPIEQQGDNSDNN